MGAMTDITDKWVLLPGFHVTSREFTILPSIITRNNGFSADCNKMINRLPDGLTDEYDDVNRILAWLTANPPGFWPQNTPTRWV